MRDCPKCGAPVDGNACASCGYNETKTTGKATVVRDPDWWRCAFWDRGERCENAGGIGLGTLGNAVWYCRTHVDIVRAGIDRKSGATPPPKGFQSLRDSLGAVPVVDDFERDEEREAIQQEGATQ